MTRPGSSHTPLGAGREFDAVRALLARWGERAAGIGDDCAVLDVAPGERLCVSTDASVEEVHFRAAWLTAAEIGYRAAAAALSDLAAMGARPVGLLLAATVPAGWTARLPALADGVGEAAGEAGCPIVGGDTTRGAALALTVTVLGAAAEPVRRGGGRPGDLLYVTGRLGGPRAALRALERGEEPDAGHRARFARPRARLREGRWLAAHGARAMIDLSDGLTGDVGHLAAACGLEATVDVARLPLVAGVAARDAARSGEEYELLCAAGAALDADAFEREFGLPLTAVGGLAEGAPGVVVVERGARVDLAGGHDHFSPA